MSSIRKVLAGVSNARLYAQGSASPTRRRRTGGKIDFVIGDEKAAEAWTAVSPVLIYSGLDLNPGDRVVIVVMVNPKEERRRG